MDDEPQGAEWNPADDLGTRTCIGPCKETKPLIKFRKTRGGSRTMTCQDCIRATRALTDQSRRKGDKT